MTPICCTPKRLPPELLLIGARVASDVNPVNRPSVAGAALILPDGVLTPQHIACLTTKYWGAKGVDLTVGFLESTPAALVDRLLSHMNAWGRRANVLFRYTKGEAQVRITREGDGYWSYLGTDILSIPPDQPTMTLEAFTMQTPDSEFYRVVRHECGHTLGFPHEHQRKAIVDRIDVEKAVEFYKYDQGWSRREVMAQVLTPMEESSLMATPADETSIMAYDAPGIITKDGKPIAGGTDINEADYAFAAKIYPKAA